MIQIVRVNTKKRGAEPDDGITLDFTYATPANELVEMTNGRYSTKLL